MSNADDAAAIDQYFRAHQNDLGAAPQYASWRAFYDTFRFWWSDDDLANAKKRRDLLNTAIGQPDLRSFSVPVEDREPLEITTSGGTSTVKIFEGGGTPPTIKKGSRGAAVSKWQGILGIAVDGNFGAGTDTATRAWQTAHGITADGIVGPATWAKVGVKTVSDITPPPAGLVALGLGLGTPPAPTSGYPTLQLGSTGPDVVRWQQIVGVSPADGEFGPITKAATMKWQTNHGIAPDGVVGPMTWKAAETMGKAPSTPAGFKPPPVTGTTGAVAPAKPQVQEAGFLGFLSGLPTWGKALVGIGVAAGVISQAGSAGKSGRGKHS